MFYRKAPAIVVPGMTYVDRGDVGVQDFSMLTMSMDDAWHDLDLSGIVGVGRRLMFLHGVTYGGVGTGIIQFQTKGNVNGVNVAAWHVVADITVYKTQPLYTDASGVVQYYASAPPAIAAGDFVVTGWFIL